MWDINEFNSYVQIPAVVARKTLSKHLRSSGWEEQLDGAGFQWVPNSPGKFLNILVLQFAPLLTGSNKSCWQPRKVPTAAGAGMCQRTVRMCSVKAACGDSGVEPSVLGSWGCLNKRP